MPGMNGKRLILCWCNWGKHAGCTIFHPENNKVTCDCGCHVKVGTV
jgi:hypothetical protein